MIRVPFSCLTAMFAITLTLPSIGFAAEQKKTRDEQVIDDRAELQENDTWIYNDLARAKDAAAEAGKPLMIVFRCIP